MKILFLSFYYEPDLSAGSFRATALVCALQRLLPAGSRIDVITTMPNRYSSFYANAAEAEESDGVLIRRIRLPFHKSGMFDQTKAFISFARAALQRTRGQKYDLVYATSSRLMTASLGAWLARRMGAPLYLDIRDIFVDTIKDVLPKKFAVPAKYIFTLLERWTINSAKKVNLVSGGFAEYFSSRYPHQSFSFFSNGIDDEFLFVAHSQSSPRRRDVLEILYAGNLGEGQGLHLIIPELAWRLRGKARFKIIGDGGRKEALRSALENKGVENVQLLPPMQRAELIDAYRESDVLFLHLNDYDAFRKVLPSKLFEYGAMGKPIWAGVSGYAADFVRLELENSAVFYPCDSEGAEQSFKQLKLGDQPRVSFVTKFARKTLSSEMALDILEQVGECV